MLCRAQAHLGGPRVLTSSPGPCRCPPPKKTALVGANNPVGWCHHSNHTLSPASTSPMNAPHTAPTPPKASSWGQKPGRSRPCRWSWGSLSFSTCTMATMRPPAQCMAPRRLRGVSGPSSIQNARGTYCDHGRRQEPRTSQTPGPPAMSTPFLPCLSLCISTLACLTARPPE